MEDEGMSFLQTNFTPLSTSNRGEWPWIDCQNEKASLYVQVMGTIIFVFVWPFIVLDMKWFPLGRPAAALMGGVLMVLFHIVVQMEVYDIQGELGNMQTIFLLVGMMILSYYFDREGLLRLVSLYIFGQNKPFKTILWKVCLLSAVLSALVTNDACCLVVTPLLLKEFLKQGRNRKELLPLTLGIATSANIGSASTFFGNPQNAFIASAAGVGLLEFFIALLPAALIGTCISVTMLYMIYWKVIFSKDTSPEDDETESIRTSSAVVRAQYTVPYTLAEERESVALSYDRSHDPYLSSAIAREREGMYEKQTTSGIPKSRSRHSLGRGASPHPRSAGLKSNVPEIRVQGEGQIVENGVKRLSHGRRSLTRDSERQPLTELPDSASLQDEPLIGDVGEVIRVKSLKERTLREKIFAGWLVFVIIALVVLLAIPPPPTVTAEFNLGCIPVAAAVCTMLADTIINKKYAYESMVNIDWTVILMFMGLFVWLGGYQNTCFPQIAFDKLSPYMNLYKVEGVLLFTVFVIIGSNIFSNVPLVILIAHQIKYLCGPEEECKGPLGGLLLAWVSTVAGNFTLIGSVANLIVAEKARSTADYRLTFWLYLQFGLISTTVVIFTMLPIVYFLGRVQS